MSSQPRLHATRPVALANDPSPTERFNGPVPKLAQGARDGGRAPGQRLMHRLWRRPFSPKRSDVHRLLRGELRAVGSTLYRARARDYYAAMLHELFHA